jgi:hypothetical protein
VDWPIDTAIQQVNAYNEVCSFYRGMELVLEAVQNGKSSTKDTSSTASTQQSSTSASLAEIRLEYIKIDDELKTTKVAAERKTLLDERAKLQGLIDDALVPAKPAAPAEQITLAGAQGATAPVAQATPTTEQATGAAK